MVENQDKNHVVFRMSNHEPLKVLNLTGNSFQTRPKTSSVCFKNNLDRFIGVTYDEPLIKDAEQLATDLTFQNFVNESREQPKDEKEEEKIKIHTEY